ncbi:MAG: ligase-associated DNA damage response exonuclease [Hyphomicrobiaceae bacterium]
MTDEPDAADFASWLRPAASGLYCVPGGFYIDPHVAVDRAIVTHGHSDHARPGHQAVLATPETLAVMRVRMGASAGNAQEPLRLGEPRRIGDVTVTLLPAGHILGSAQVLIEYRGRRAVVTGDYKCRPDPTCTAWESTTCDLLITEATFGLPVFRHPPDTGEIAKLLASQQLFPERTHLVGVYGLGKCQRLIALLRQAGYDRPIWLHGALVALCDLYREIGIELGELRKVADATQTLAGEIVLAPPSALADRWSRRLVDPVTVLVSGWMRVRGRARQRGVELPLIISDHVDWPELVANIEASGAEEIWVTHGREEALVHQAQRMGRRARALALVGREDDAE